MITEITHESFQLDVPGEVRHAIVKTSNLLLANIPMGTITDEVRWNDLANLHTALTMLENGYVYSAVIHLQAILKAHGQEQAVNSVWLEEQ